MSGHSASVGIADHAGWAALVAVDGAGALLVRRRVELLDEGLPKLPHHHECQGLPPDAALDLIERVRASAGRRARAALEALAADLDLGSACVALRALPDMPATVAGRIADYRAQNQADGAMYRAELVRAAEALGWSVAWYERRTLFADAAQAFAGDLAAHLRATGAALGPPWQQDQRTAMAAAILAGARRARRR